MVPPPRPSPPHKHCKGGVNISVLFPSRAQSSPWVLPTELKQLLPRKHCPHARLALYLGSCEKAIASLPHKAISSHHYLGPCKLAATVPICGEERGDLKDTCRRFCCLLVLERGGCRSSLLGTGQAGEIADMPCRCCCQFAICWKQSTSGVTGSRPVQTVCKTFAFVTGRDRPLTDSMKFCCSREDHKARTNVWGVSRQQWLCEGTKSRAPFPINTISSAYFGVPETRKRACMPRGCVLVEKAAKSASCD